MAAENTVSTLSVYVVDVYQFRQIGASLIQSVFLQCRQQKPICSAVGGD